MTGGVSSCQMSLDGRNFVDPECQELGRCKGHLASPRDKDMQEQLELVIDGLESVNADRLAAEVKRADGKTWTILIEEKK